LGVLYNELLAPEEALQLLEETLVLARELRSQVWINYIIGMLAGIYLELGHIQSAYDCLETTLSLQTSMDTLGKRYCWARRAELALLQGDPALTLDITERLIASAPDIYLGRVVTFLWMLKAKALAALGHEEDACALLQSAIENARATGERFLLWRVHASRGRICHDMEQLAESEKEFSAARTLIDELAATAPDEALKDGFLLSASSIL
ncbi:MAG: hypothetical protein GY805_17505, partial [Chloroflexi bacterium]|nr:hypothetical protein [Chloroflexota bacterium]